MVSGLNSDDEKLVIEESGKCNENSNSLTPDIEKFDRVRAAIHDRRGGPGGPHSPPHNVFVGSGGVGVESNDGGGGGEGKAGGGGDRIRSVSRSLFT